MLSADNQSEHMDDDDDLDIEDETKVDNHTPRPSEEVLKLTALNFNNISLTFQKQCSSCRKSSSCPNYLYCRDSFSSISDGLNSFKKIRKLLWEGTTIAKRIITFELILINNIIEIDNKKSLSFFLNGVPVCKSYYRVRKTC